MFAVIKVGGKQYRAGRDEELVVDRLAGEVGDSVELPVSFTADGDDVDLSGGTARVE
ncbi:MAG: bL21 family ribosomal protein, partial [Actinomycetota bacterium]|nr:bL21 family ribosomal protein [Actinomycetota bacterium]